MKKKLLSLVLAGAMVASTSVSAFADDKDITVENKGTLHEVEVTGNVADTKDQTLPGTITVTVPTTMAFTINKDGNIDGGDITIRNKSTESVEVIAKEFIDATPDSGIIVKMESELTDSANANTNENRYVSLKLEGQKSVGLISNKQKTGLVNLSNNNEFEPTENPSLGTIIPKGDLSLRLTGVAKKGTSGNYEAPDKPINNRFTLKLKIQKAK